MSEFPKEFEAPDGKRVTAHTAADAITLQYGHGYKEVSGKAKTSAKSESKASGDTKTNGGKDSS